jgi:hypothetical protein
VVLGLVLAVLALQCAPSGDGNGVDDVTGGTPSTVDNGGGSGSDDGTTPPPGSTEPTSEDTTTTLPPNGGGDTTTTTMGSTTTLPDEEPPKNIDECEQQASDAEGQLVYEPERQMVVDRLYDVRAALSLGDLPPDITFETPTTSVAVTDIRCTVQAGLTGSDFEITPDEPREQSFIGRRELVWEWQVRPKRAGDDLKLILTLQAKVVQANPPRTEFGPEILNTSVIDVDAKPESLSERITSFFASPMVAPIYAALVALVLAKFQPWRWISKKRPPTNQRPPA